MNKIFFITCLIIFIGHSNNIKAQQLKIGDKFPEIVLNNILNRPEPTFNTKSFKGKFIILDFWGTGCSSCIAAFSKMEKIELQQKGIFKFISINSESLDSTRKFFKRHPKIKIPSFLMISGDKVLSQMFPHVFVPHVVWIDSTGIIRNITGGNMLSEETVDTFVKTQTIHSRVKKDLDISKFNFQQPFLAEGNFRWLEKVERYSSIMHYIPGINIGTSLNVKEDGETRFYCSSSILELLKRAFSEGKDDINKFVTPNSIRLISKDPEKFVYPRKSSDYDQWAVKHQYLYEAYLKHPKKNEIYQIMQSDLCSYFHLKAEVLKEKMKCWVLIKTKNPNKRSTGHSVIAGNSNKNSIPYWNFKDSTNVLAETLTTILARGAKINSPIINETGVKDIIHLKINLSVIQDANLMEIINSLRKSGFDLVEKKRFVDVLRIEEI